MLRWATEPEESGPKRGGLHFLFPWGSCRKKMYIWFTSPGDGQTSCKVWLASTELRRCSNEAKTQSPLKLLGCPELVNRSQPLVGRSSPYCKYIWRRHCCLIKFFRLSTYDLVAKIQPDKVVRWCPNGEFFAIFCVLYFSEPRAAHFRPAF